MMKLQRLQLTIALIALIAALALAAAWKPAHAQAGEQDCTEYCETGAAFIADYAAAHFACKGDRDCINQKMRELGWTQQGEK